MLINFIAKRKLVNKVKLKQPKKLFCEMDPFLFQAKKPFSFPPNNIEKDFTLKDKDCSIHKALLNYLEDVNSGGRGTNLKKLIDITEEKNTIKVNIIDVYKFQLDINVILDIKEKLGKKKNANKLLRVFFDGGCARSDRLGFFGCSFYLEDDHKIAIVGNIGPDNTNNTAEYTGLIMSLLFLVLVNPKIELSLKLFSDSELLCRQMNGRYKVVTPHIIILHSIAKNLYNKLEIKNKEIIHIRREFNAEADSIANYGKSLENNTFQIYY